MAGADFPPTRILPGAYAGACPVKPDGILDSRSTDFCFIALEVSPFLRGDEGRVSGLALNAISKTDNKKEGADSLFKSDCVIRM
jgi:hypothetical protein